MKNNHSQTWLDVYPLRSTTFLKRIACLLLAMVVAVNVSFAAASLQDENVKLPSKTVKFKDLVKSIESQTDFLVVFNSSGISEAETISVNDQNDVLESILSQVSSQKHVDFALNDNYIIISKKEASLKNSAQQKATISGVVKDANGEVLIGATVLIKGTNSAVITDSNGNFSINGSIPTTLVASYIGCADKEIIVSSQKLLNVILDFDDTMVIDDVVVVGFGTVKKSSLTGSISVVKADQLADRPVANVGQALQGVVPGLNFSVNSSGGELNNNLSVDIRGTGTIGTGSTSAPLVLIDGMEGDMNTLNPQDIESISVMKDAASATIYGSRAPFGVILITTKSGAKGKVSVNYNNNFRVSKPMLHNSMNSWEYANFINESSSNSGGVNQYDPDELKKIQDYMSGAIDYATEPQADNKYYKGSYDSWGNTDWVREFYRETVFSQEHNASVSGGTDRTQYYVSAGWLDQGGAGRYTDEVYDRLSFNVRVNSKINDWLEIGATSRYINTHYNKPQAMSSLMYHNVFRIAPTTPSSFPVDSENPLEYVNYGDWSMNLAQIRYGGRTDNKSDSFTQQFNITATPLKDWNIIGELNYRVNTQFENEQFKKTYHQTPTGDIQPDGYSTGSDWVEEYIDRSVFINPNVYTNYTKTLGKHYFKVTAGMQTELYDYRKVYSYGYNLIVDEFPTLDNTTTDPYVSGSYSDWATAGFFARLNYTYNDKYIVELNGRYDGTSRFLRDQRWNFFPSVSVGWNVTKERFLSDVKNLNSLKLRGSWGELGNQNTSSYYPFYQQLSVSKNYGWMVNGVRPPIYTSAPGLVSSMLTWETVRSWNIGLDFALYDYRLTGSVEVFNRQTLDMVGPAPVLPATLGISAPNINNTDQVSRGWELELSWRDKVESIGLSYGVRATLSDSRRFVTSYPNETMDIDYWYDGQEAGLIWGYTTIGIAQSQEEMDAHLAKVDQSAIGSQWEAGDIMYADLNGDGKVDGGEGVLGSTGDMTVIGNSQIRYNYGVTVDARWKGFDFSMFFQGVGKRDLALSGSMFWAGNTSAQVNGIAEHLDYWRPEDTESPLGANTDAYYPRPFLNGDSKNQQTQTGYLQNGAYLRLKNIQLGYTVPECISNKFNVDNLRIFFSGDNIATMSKISPIFDPEAVSGGYGSGKTYPLSKVYSFGITLTL